MIQTDLISKTYLNRVEKFVFTGNSYNISNACPQPMKVGNLMDLKLEPINKGYVVSTIMNFKILAFNNGSDYI
jgi:hypothetical protein